MLEIRAHVRRPRGFELSVDTEIAQPLAGVFGPSGAGKSTLLETVAGLVRPSAGRVVLDGEVLLNVAGGICVPPHKRRIGMVFQDARLLPHRSVRGNLDFGRRLLPRRARRFTVREVAEWLDISHLLSRRPATLSGGEAQRVALGRAILTNPKLLLLDEPFAGQDVGRRRRILPKLREIHERTGIPMLLVSHELPDVLSLTDWLVLLDAGRVVGQGRYLDLVRCSRHARVLADSGLTNVLALRVVRHCRGAGQTLLRWDAPTPPREEHHRRPRWVRGPMDTTLTRGCRVQAALRSRDIALALAPVEFISMQNQFPGVIESVERLGSRTVCVVDVGVRLLVEITPQTRLELGLSAGKRIWCLFKTRALELGAASPGQTGNVLDERPAPATDPWEPGSAACPPSRWSRP
jgi:molybdate transport system ATP-binding protein